MDDKEESPKEFELGIEQKLKGDVIGDTMYTQRFVLTTLLKLKNPKWDKALEDDLCFLWDSTLEKQVCEYLMEIDFPSIACCVILEYNTLEYGRLIEILVGILANISTAICQIPLKNEQIDTILNLLTSTDSLILIQVMRFIVAYYYSNPAFLTCDRAEDISHLFKFVFRSSTNFDLVQKTLEALAKITINFKENMFFDSEIVQLSLKACVRLLTEDYENDFELFSSDQRSSAKYLVEYIMNFCVHTNQVESLLSKMLKTVQNCI
ncbi:hypothetical protein HHI36_009062 [Cryptolaemus montrouzieri]|uniref:Uncharacterized protein n=1 Tax=Cryptolaemus montrouzieri TaxID=559131 RepID=A0ABD2MV22_9CUCU